MCCAVPASRRPTAKLLVSQTRASSAESAALTTKASRDLSTVLTEFFDQKFAPFILNPCARVAIAVVAIAWLIPAIVYVAKTQATTKAEEFLSSDHPIQKWLSITQDSFPTSEREPGLPIVITWGIADISRGGVNQLLDPGNIGTPSFDEKFSTSAAMLDHVLDSCAALGYGVSKEAAEFGSIVATDAEDGMASVKCPLALLKLLIEQGPSVWTAAAPIFAMHGITAATPAAARWAQAAPHLESFIPTFLDTPVPGEMTTIRSEYGELIGWDAANKKLRFLSIEAEHCCTTQWKFMTRPRALQEYRKYEDFVSAMNARAPAGAALCSQTTIKPDGQGKWNEMNNQKIFRQSAVSGASIGIALAFAVISLCTRSLVIALSSTLSIACTLLSVIGVMNMAGWELGTIEAILISITAGFSVDYVVHLAHAYVQKQDCSRQVRIREAFEEMGVSVFSGMATSFFSAVCLLFTEIRFFYKFGVFLSTTIIFSWLWANFVFMSVLAVVGPGEVGVAPQKSIELPVAETAPAFDSDAPAPATAPATSD